VTAAVSHLVRKAALPRLAASLVIFDNSGPEPRFLMGQRHPDLQFMPGYFVFPGGKVDRSDDATALQGALRPDDDRAYRQALLRRFRHRGLAPLAAALREADEEAGFVFHMAQEPADLEPADLEPADLEPADLADFHYLGRAVTPSIMPRRFDAHFFMVDRARARLVRDDPSGPESELTSLAWLTFDDALKRPIAAITRAVLSLAHDELPVMTGRLSRARSYGRWLWR
jgi:8-oxo-dGTP pyrophosphatase MutT (NUDIX family)